MNTMHRYPDDGAEFVKECIGDPRRLMKLAEEGRLSKAVLATALAPGYRDAFLDACAAIEKRVTEACAAKGDFCIGSECAVEGEVCLEAILDAEPDFSRAVGAEWIAIFADPNHRIAAWRT
jgi:hypothetical protein